MKIKQLPSGRWLVRISLQEDGKTREMSKTFPKRRDAEKWQRHNEVSRDAGTLRRPSRQTTGQYLSRWLRDLTGVGGRTREDYENIVRRYLGRTREECEQVTARYGVSPALGLRQLDRLTPPMVREALATLSRPSPGSIEKYSRAVEAKVHALMSGTPPMDRIAAEQAARLAYQAQEPKGLNPRTVAYARAVLRRALNQAVSDGVLLTNPARGHGLVPRQERGEMQVLSATQVKQVLADTADDPLHALWAVLLTGGLRLSEALALRWTDLDLERGELRVVRKLRRPMSGGVWLLEDCKTERSRRAVPLVAVTLAALVRHRDKQGAERLAAGDGYRDQGFVFADERGDPLRGDGVTKYHWRPTLVRLHLPPVKLHGARHTAATLLLQAGQPMKVVQEMLGHSSMAVTSDLYSHVTPAFKRQAADALAEYLERAE